MKLKSLLIGDIRFQFKYGFYFLYLLFTLFYVGLIYAFPEAWREKAAIVMIFTDPAAMGLFFMGAIVLFEKSERVLDTIAVSPVTPLAYVLSKLISIAVISVVVGIIIGIAGSAINNVFYFITGVFLCSCIFSALGLFLASKATTLNEFIIFTIPVELLVNLPAIAYLFGWQKSWLIIHPGVCMIELCLNGNLALPAFFIMIFWVAVFIAVANLAVKKMLRTLGGVKL